MKRGCPLKVSDNILPILTREKTSIPTALCVETEVLFTYRTFQLDRVLEPSLCDDTANPFVQVALRNLIYVSFSSLTMRLNEYVPFAFVQAARANS